MDEIKQLDYESQKLKDYRDMIELQTIIGKYLSEGSRTEDDLIKLIPNAKYDQIVGILKNMLFLKLITKDGYPVKYSISKEISEKLIERKRISETDKNLIKIAVLIESKSNDKAELRKANDQIAASLKADEQYLVYDLNIAEIVLHDDLFSTYISAEVSCSSLNSVFRLIYFYGATSIEVLKPDKYTVSLSDLQQTAQIITDMTHGYAQMIYELRNKNDAMSKFKK
ncbi:MAG: hypothetical protein WCX82_04385 [archaeon]|jgi:hypothetical protein